MKKAGALAASIAAASSAALASTADCSATVQHHSNECLGSSTKDAGSGKRKGGDKDKFAPRFDGLRFIETLVTAHR